MGRNIIFMKKLKNIISNTGLRDKSLITMPTCLETHYVLESVNLLLKCIFLNKKIWKENTSFFLNKKR